MGHLSGDKCLAMSVDIFGCHNLGDGNDSDLEWVEIGDAAQHPTEFRADPTSESDPAPNVSGPGLGDPGSCGY